MKNKLTLAFAVALSSLVTACGNGGGGGNESKPEPDPVVKVTPASLELSSTTQLMLADGETPANLFVVAKDAQGNTLNDNQYDVTFHTGSETFNAKAFVTDLDQEHVIYATSGEVESNSVTLTARENVEFPIVEIPLIFHVVTIDGEIRDGGADSDSITVTTASLEEAVETLNRHFSNGFASHNSNAFDTGIRFRLARYAPDGSPLEEVGINRIDGTNYDDGRLGDSQYPSPSDFPGDKQFGSLEVMHIANDHHWDESQYNNVLILDAQDASWAAYYPMPVDGMLPGQRTHREFFGGDVEDRYTDILVIRPILINANVFAHEMGHQFNLGHVFSYNDDCENADHSPDTYSYKKSVGLNAICEEKSLGMNKLHPNDEVYHHDNIMDYYNGINTFTYDQATRMRFVIENAMWIQDLIHSTK